MSIKSDVKHAKHQALQQLTTLRDEARVQVHLLTLDARQRWNELEKQISALEQRANHEGEKAGETLREAAQCLTHTLNDLIGSHMNHSAGLLTNVRSLMMTHVRTCQPEDALSRAAQLMWEGDCGAIPVVRDDAVVAFITDRDICMATYTQGKAPDELKVEDAMSKALFSCAPDESVEAVLSTMAAKRVRRLPVIGQDGKLLGIISLADVARWARSLANASVNAALTETLAVLSALSPQKLQAAAE